MGDDGGGGFHGIEGGLDLLYSVLCHLEMRVAMYSYSGMFVSRMMVNKGEIVSVVDVWPTKGMYVCCVSNWL